MNKSIIKKLSISIYTTTGFPYGMASENLIRQVSLGIKEMNIPVNVVRLCGENNRNKAANDTGISVSNLLFNKKLNGIWSIINIIIIPIIFPFSILKNKIKCKTNTVIIYNVNFAYWGAPIIVWCKLFGIKIYSIETERYLREYFGKEWYKYPRWLTYKMQYKFFDKYLDGKVCLSSYLINDALKYGIMRNRLLLIPHFIDISSFSEEKNQPDKDYFTIGFSGAIYSLNGILILINAFKLLLSNFKNARLLLIGNIHQREKQTFVDAISQIKENLIFPGMVPSKEVSKYLSICDVLVNPREKSILANSGFPTKIGEYLATGKVVVSSRTGDLDHYFHDKKDIYYFESGNVNELANLLIFIYNNRKTASEVAQKGKLCAIRHLDYIQSTKKLVNFIIKT
jgi:glycosyltransferase involved in cell wall biosynthesis